LRLLFCILPPGSCFLPPHQGGGSFWFPAFILYPLFCVLPHSPLALALLPKSEQFPLPWRERDRGRGCLCYAPRGRGLWGNPGYEPLTSGFHIPHSASRKQCPRIFMRRAAMGKGKFRKEHAPGTYFTSSRMTMGAESPRRGP